MFILEITAEACKDPILARSLSLIHTAFKIIAIIVPILLIVSASISVASMMMNPEQKNGTKKIVTKFAAAVIIFFLPLITDIVMSWLPGDSFSISACWNAADEASKDIKLSTFENWEVGSGGLGGNLQLLANYAGRGNNNAGASSGSNIIPIGGMPIPYYNQGDYADVKFDLTGESVASAGCGFVSTAMVLSYLTGSDISPKEIVEWGQHSYFVKAGMSWSMPIAAAAEYNVGSVESFDKYASGTGNGSAERVIQALKNNQPVMSSQKKGIFCGGPHIIVLRGIDPDTGRIYVNNPSKPDQSTQTFSIDEIEEKARHYWVFEAKK